uniref:caffeoyl-CoA O-methyltransferase n=1 Tax=Solanum lycopersicum TaxID=4081 RepID=K4BZY2_SOLLC
MIEIEVFTGYSLLLTALTIPENDNAGSFDFAFIDINKVNYQKYHERMLELV